MKHSVLNGDVMILLYIKAPIVKQCIGLRLNCPVFL